MPAPTAKYGLDAALAGPKAQPRLAQVIIPEETRYIEVKSEKRIPTATEVTNAIQSTLESFGFSMDKIDLDLCNVVTTMSQSPKPHEFGFVSTWATRYPQFKIK